MRPHMIEAHVQCIQKVVKDIMGSEIARADSGLPRRECSHPDLFRLVKTVKVHVAAFSAGEANAALAITDC